MQPLINAMEDDDFDYQAYTRENPPDPAKIRRGAADRQRRFNEAMMRLIVPDDDEEREI